MRNLVKMLLTRCDLNESSGDRSRFTKPNMTTTPPPQDCRAGRWSFVVLHRVERHHPVCGMKKKTEKNS